MYNHGLHHGLIYTFLSKIQRFMQKLVPNVSRSLTFKDHTLTRLWLVITFTINLSNQLTFSTMYLIHVLSLLITEYSFKGYDLRIAIHSIHAIDEFNLFNKHKIFKQTKPLQYQSNCKLFNKLSKFNNYITKHKKTVLKHKLKIKCI